MTSSNYPLTLFFDGECPVCRTEMASLRQRDAAGHLRFEDVRAAGFVVPAGTQLERMLTTIHARTADGRIVTGVETLRLAYRAVGLGWLIAPTTWPGLRGASERLYLFVARHRFSMPAWLGLAGFGVRPHKAHCDDSTCSF